jgi:putative transposase
MIEPRQSFSGHDVVAAQGQAIARSGTPVSITVDHGTEFTSRALEDWAWRRGVKLDFIHPGKPTESGHMESFSDRLRDECLNVMQFTSLQDAKQKIEAWRIDYNQHRPHSSLGNLTPSEFVRKRQEYGSSAAAIF